jgi:hypothetical protein
MTGHLRAICCSSMTQMLWNVVLRGREPVFPLAGATTASLDGALQVIREEIPTETPAATWTFEMNGKAVTFEEFSRLASTPGATGDFVASAPSETARIQSRPVVSVHDADR